MAEGSRKTDLLRLTQNERMYLEMLISYGAMHASEVKTWPANRKDKELQQTLREMKRVGARLLDRIKGMVF